MRHLEDRGEDAVNDEADHDRPHHRGQPVAQQALDQDHQVQQDDRWIPAQNQQKDKA